MDEKLEKYIRSVALPTDTQLGDLKIKGIIGVGLSGIVYEAYDSTTQRVIALKEYFPARLAKRNKDLSIAPLTEDNKPAYQAGLKAFLDKGIQLSRVRHANIVQLLKVEEKNNTVYLQMEKVEGPLLSQRLGAGHFIAPDVVKGWIEKILDAVKCIHDNGILHLAIDPSNIIINERLGPVLIDFGQAQQDAPTDQILRDNPYRAIELISSSQDQIGKHTDIYAVGAIFSHLVTGTAPVPSSSRSTAKNDPQTHAATNAKIKKIYSSSLLGSIDTALAIRPESRFANIDEWVEAISEKTVSKVKKKKNMTLVLAGVFIAAIVAWLGYGKNYYTEYKIWNSLSADEPCSASLYVKDYPNGRYAQEAATRLALCQERMLQAENEEKEAKNKQIQEIVGSMIPINPGCFMMGSPADEPGRSDIERQHEVCIESPYEIGTYEITMGQFRRFVNEKQYKTDAERNKDETGCFALDPADEEPWGYKPWASWQSPFKNQNIDDSFPVVCVSSNDINQFLKWLNSIADTEYRLPTEAEWEFAVRGKSESVSRPWGDRTEDACRYGNVADMTNIPEITGLQSNASPWPDAHPCTDNALFATPVGSYKPNHNGIYDLIGNVWELTCSAYSGSYGDLEKECINDEESMRVDRGGAWDSNPANARSATRGEVPYFGRASKIGFRLARTM